MPLLNRRPLPRAVVGLGVVLASLMTQPASAIGRRIDLATMTARAGTIVAGRIVSIRADSHPKYHRIGALYVTVRVSDMIKGAPTHKFTFMLFTGGMLPQAKGKQLAVGRSLPSLPAFRVGEEVVLFLYPPSHVGFTSPVGGAEGKFQIHRQPGQPTTVASEAGNSSLAVVGSLPTSLKPSQQRLLLHPPSALDYQTFRSTIKQLVQSEKS
jgi:hypothetical protein